jgi:hypothetical protein
MSEAEEKAANLALNSESLSGHWEADQLADLLRDPDVDLEIAGADASDVFRLLGEESRDSVLEEIAQRVEQISEARESTKEAVDLHSQDFYAVFVFKTPKERAAFFDRAGLDQNRFQDGRALEALLSKAPIK